MTHDVWLAEVEVLPIHPHRVCDLVETFWIDLEVDHLLQHGLCQHCELVTEAATEDVDGVATVPHGEAEFCKRRVVYILSDVVVVEVGEQFGQDVISRGDVKERRVQRYVALRFGEPESIILFVPKSRYGRVAEKCWTKRRLKVSLDGKSLRSNAHMFNRSFSYVQLLRNEQIWSRQMQTVYPYTAHSLLSALSLNL